MVKANIEKAQAKQKEQHDEKHTLAGSFSIGALVLKKDFTRKRRRGGALDYRWLGLYTITTSLGKGLYRLECVQTGAVVNRVNGFHLKPFHAGDDGEPNGKLDSAEQNDALRRRNRVVLMVVNGRVVSTMMKRSVRMILMVWSKQIVLTERSGRVALMVCSKQMIWMSWLMANG